MALVGFVGGRITPPSKKDKKNKKTKKNGKCPNKLYFYYPSFFFFLFCFFFRQKGKYENEIKKKTAEPL